MRPASRKGRSRTLKISQVVLSITSWTTKNEVEMWIIPKTTKKMKETLAMEERVFCMWVL